jgi:hypothetical protein
MSCRTTHPHRRKQKLALAKQKLALALPNWQKLALALPNWPKLSSGLRKTNTKFSLQQPPSTKIHLKIG